MHRALRVAFLAMCALLFLRPSFGEVAVAVSFGPPALPVYDLPPCPGDGYLWTPGYWAWDADFGDYYWVPGTWVLAPEPGLLWTPGWWGWEDTGFIFHEGFWGPTVGFYGGIDYGFGYFGMGFVGGRWDGGVFRYNTAVLNVNATVIHNTYVDRTVIENRSTDNRVSYNGGQGGIDRRPTPEEERAGQGRHVPPVAAQQQHMDAARSNPQMRASANQGKPPIAATSRPGEFSGHNVVAAHAAGAPYHPPANAGHPQDNARPGENPAGHEENPSHASDLQQHQVTPVNTGNPKLDQKYQKQQQKLADKQNKEHQKLAQQQEKEHQQAQKQNYDAQKQQQMEQKHQQQTQQMEQRHTQETQRMQTRQAEPRRR
jgi:WXXGXW repeat (2 copies)